MRFYLILLGCSLSLGALSQQKESQDSLKKWRQDTTFLGQRLIFLRNRAEVFQKELQHQFYQIADTKNMRDTLQESDPKIHQFHWDSLTNVMTLQKYKMAEVQKSFDSVLIQLDSVMDAQATATERLKAASHPRH
jgi:hypothetical protein